MENINSTRNIMGMAEILADSDDEIDIDDLEKSIMTGGNYKKESSSKLDVVDEYNKEIDQMLNRFNLNDQIDTNDIKIPSVLTSKPTINIVEEVDEEEETKPVYPTTFKGRYEPPVIKDQQYNKMTNEEMKQNIISNVMDKMETVDDEAKFLQDEEDEDEMVRLIEQIDQLKSTLEAEGVNLSRVADVSEKTTRKEARTILKLLQLKNDRLRYCSMVEEGILASAYGLESIFDGKKEYFGTKIDLVGWSDTVKVKMHRMRYHTSNFVGDVIKDYSISSGWRILLELLPSMFLYSRDRRLKARDNLVNDAQYNDAVQNLNRR